MIVDACTFFDEVDVLDLRLNELRDVVDHFVIVEADTTFQGVSKPMYFEQNKEKFSHLAHKIHYHSVHLVQGGAWNKESESRDILAIAIQRLGVNSDDVVVFSDCDEIPSPKAISEFRPEMKLRNLKQYSFYYHFNNMMNYGRREWSRARIGSGDQILSLGREFRGGPRDLDHTFPSLEDGGWHCGWFGCGLERIRRKVNSFSHDDMAPIVNKATDRQLLSDVIDGIDLFHRQGVGKGEHWSSDDPRLPQYFLKNQHRFEKFTREHYESLRSKV
jgi:beta-1,4-mannosyl-glycoprotein beta-1,4-N-acetylglucosaminyltransferase